ncbi:ergothioneine biosynthesis protein EgtB [Marinilabiliaceae bacterium JC017]|nr:ergothioneine biosynthesis protein EgtB [Marinilabiliaceae bacterium JC017]
MPVKPYQQELLLDFRHTREASVKMCQPLFTEDYIPQPAEFTSPPKWNLAHTTWFFETFILEPFDASYELYNKAFPFLFNSYYQWTGERIARNQRGSITRPTVGEVYKYRLYVDNHLEALLQSKLLPHDIINLILIGINHEEQHQELFYSDLKYTFSLNPLYPVYTERAMCEEGNAGDSSFIPFEAGIYEIGYQGNGFCYDNEQPIHRVYLPAFEIREKLVSNGEYLAFINDGGYTNFSFWHDEAWKWLHDNHIKHPLYWQKRGNKWFQYTLAGLRIINEADPLTHISYYEAFAFAQWKGCRLPTEFEWEVASIHISWGDRWEWTESAYLPYPGFNKPTGAIGEYNGKFMVNQKVLRGASVATVNNHSRKSYRNFFHPHLFWQFNGIRLSK